MLDSRKAREQTGTTGHTSPATTPEPWRNNMTTTRKFDTVGGTHRAPGNGQHASPREALPTEARLAYVDRHAAKETTKSDIPHRDGRTDK